MGSESKAHEAKGYSKIQLVGQKHRLDKTTLASKTRFVFIVFIVLVFKAGAFRY